MSDSSDIPPFDVSADHPKSEHWVWAGKHRPPIPRALVEQMTRDWAPRATSEVTHPAVAHNAERRRRLAEAFAHHNLVIPTGPLKIRSNDTDFRFRPGTDFYWLTGHDEPDSVLLLQQSDSGPRATLYLESPADNTSHRFFTDTRYGELWTGPRSSLKETAHYLNIETADLERLAADLGRLDPATTLVLRDLDPRVDELIPPQAEERQLTEALNELRLVKDEFEVTQLQEAVDATIKGFEDVVRALPEAMERGERVVEGVFNLRARVEGNDVGYRTIAASGAHATVLHWPHNDGEVRSGDLLLLDAGVECRQLYTADVTRTLPVSGHFSPTQREVYELVLAAQRAAIAVVKPGADFNDPHRAAMRTLTEGLRTMGIIDVDVDTALRADLQLYRRYTLHGTSHMLGIDVHDCAHARSETYNGALQAGYVLTVEPGLYFQMDDLTVPEKYRGIGVRIEDDILVTPDGCRVLSAALPTDPDDIERWMRELGHNQPGGSKPGLLG